MWQIIKYNSDLKKYSFKLLFKLSHGLCKVLAVRINTGPSFYYEESFSNGVSHNL